jgi:hypothetical protein
LLALDGYAIHSSHRHRATPTSRRGCSSKIVVPGAGHMINMKPPTTANQILHDTVLGLER